ncbi:hypothetical protein BLTE_08230 [Blastochloris tepida]|uniref:Uncharacterized protein n=1 Tax=Blastochloris tepida TaxID=2233851 RepID=A0A348FXV5_9HYPH|nr:hypothetical protein BLTE_08230 [Blastochloris tepida]
MAARLDPQDAEPTLGIVEGDALDEPGKGFSGRRIRQRLHGGHYPEQRGNRKLRIDSPQFLIAQATFNILEVDRLGPLRVPPHAQPFSLSSLRDRRLCRFFAEFVDTRCVGASGL